MKTRLAILGLLTLALLASAPVAGLDPPGDDVLVQNHYDLEQHNFDAIAGLEVSTTTSVIFTIDYAVTGAEEVSAIWRASKRGYQVATLNFERIDDNPPGVRLFRL